MSENFWQCTLDVINITDSLSEVMGLIKLHKKKILEIYFFVFYLRKLSRLRGQCCSTVLVIDTLMSNIADPSERYAFIS